MGGIKQEHVSDVERRIVTGLAVSDAYVRKVRPFWTDDLIESPELKRVARWCLDHFDRYGRVPDTDLRGIFFERVREEDLPKAEAEHIERVLEHVSNEYGRGEQFNADYLYDRTVRHLREREMDAWFDEVLDARDRGDLDKVEEARRNFKPRSVQSARGLEIGTAAGLDALEGAFRTVRKSIISYPGALGELINSELCRDSFVAFAGPEKRGKCLTGDQGVLMSTGEVLRIIDVIAQKRRDVIAYDEKAGRFVKANVSHFHVNGMKRVWRVTTKTGRRVEATLNHPFLSPGGWVELGDLSLGDFVAVPKEIPVFGDAELSDEQVRVLAYVIADGCLGNATNSIVGFTKADTDIQEDFDRCVSAMGCRTTWDGIGCRVWNSEEDKGRHGRNHVMNFLDAHGLMRKRSYEKTIPDVVYRLPSAGMRTFLSVLITCDGWVDSNDGGIGFAVANEVLARQVQELLSRFGVVSKIHFKANDHRGAWTISVRSYENIVKFRDRIGLLFGKGRKLDAILSSRIPSMKSFLDKFPAEVAQRFYAEVEEEFGVSDAKCDKRGAKWAEFSKRFTKGADIRQRRGKGPPVMRQSFSEVVDTVAGRKYLDSQILWDEVVGIEFVGTAETFDLTVDEHHNFVAENIVVHNSFWLLDVAVRALRQDLNVAFFQAGDMTEKQQLRRLAVHIVGWSDDPKACEAHWRPVNDCVRNQFDACERSDRNCDHGIHDGSMDEFFRERTEYECLSVLVEKARDFAKYRPCDSASCPDYRPTVWMVHEPEREPLTAGGARKRVERFLDRHRRRFKLVTYTRNTLSTAEMSSVLDEWERQDDFVPDVIVVDYADIMSSNEREFRHRQDDIWGNLRGISQERHALLVTATQTDAASYKQNRIGMSNFTEDKRKNAHVTAMYALNRDPAGREKAMNLMRIGTIVVRESAFSVDDEVTVLQHMEIGRPFVGSYKR